MTEKDQPKTPDPDGVPPIQEKPYDPPLTSDTTHGGGTGIIDRPPFGGEDDER
jgi:hypothetical protein